MFVVANSIDDSPIEGASIKIDDKTTAITDKNGNHVEHHCQAVEKGKVFPIKKDEFCDCSITMDVKLEGTKAYKWIFLRPKTGKTFIFKVVDHGFSSLYF